MVSVRCLCRFNNKNRYVDDRGVDLTVPPGATSAADYNSAKVAVYRRAIAAWNILDTGKRARITHTAVADEGVTDALHDRWAGDDGL